MPLIEVPSAAGVPETEPDERDAAAGPVRRRRSEQEPETVVDRIVAGRGHYWSCKIDQLKVT